MAQFEAKLAQTGYTAKTPKETFMDKTAKRFVIAACAVVISVPVVIILQEIKNAIQANILREEQERMIGRYQPCNTKWIRGAIEHYDKTGEAFTASAAEDSIKRCQKDTNPVSDYRYPLFR